MVEEVKGVVSTNGRFRMGVLKGGCLEAFTGRRRRTARGMNL
jgi:hypothetical protein